MVSKSKEKLEKPKARHSVNSIVLLGIIQVSNKIGALLAPEDNI
jgi:translation initiation factor 6 (eIF-6)